MMVGEIRLYLVKSITKQFVYFISHSVMVSRSHEVDGVNNLVSAKGNMDANVYIDILTKKKYLYQTRDLKHKG